MKDYFSIGEISELTGLSNHALRYYDKIHLVTPAIVNEQTGYRYYSYLQLFTLDWVRHLQSFGFSLDEIREILSDVSAAALMRHLEEKQAELEAEMERLRVLRDTVSYYLAYYGGLGQPRFPDLPYIRQEERRFLFTERYEPGEAIHGTAGYRLMARKSRTEYHDLYFLKRTGYLLDSEALGRGEVIPLEYFMYLEKPPRENLPQVREIPAGEYLCYRCRLLSPEADLSALRRFLPENGKGTLVMASECDYSLDDSIQAYERLFFEVQIRL